MELKKGSISEDDFKKASSEVKSVDDLLEIC